MIVGDIIFEILKHTSDVNMRAISKLFRYEFDRRYSACWRHDILCANVGHEMRLAIDVAQVAGKPIHDWVFDVVKPHEYAYLVHSAAVIKYSYTMRGIIVKASDLRKLDEFDLKRVNWNSMATMLKAKDLNLFADYIDDWDDVRERPYASLIEKCHNASMLRYISQYDDIYPYLTAADVDRMRDILDWRSVVSRSHCDTWHKYADELDWSRLSSSLFANMNNARYVDWSVYSVRSLSDNDFKNFGDKIWTDMIEEAWLQDKDLIRNHIALYGHKHQTYRICVNGKQVTFNGILFFPCNT